ncbi:MAG: DNA repair protein RadC [Muribaculaceae bacterium]|nr:DNA repair protein RadC [Muribaculaceae bacterium]
MEDHTTDSAKSNLIRDIDPEMRPREKAMRYGLDALSDAELMAIVFATGIRGKGVVQLSEDMLQDNGNHLSRLTRMSVKEMTRRYKGIGQAKALTLLAALKLGERSVVDALATSEAPITCSRDAYDHMARRMVSLPHEEFWLMFLNQAGRVISTRRMGQGGVAGTLVDVRLLAKAALEELATAVIAFHNHPSGNLHPSKQDETLTRKIRDGLALLDIRLNDHIIIGPGGYYSFNDEGKL